MKRKIIITIVVILLIAVIGIGTYFIIRTNNLEKYRKADKYNIKGEEIISVKTVLPELNLKKYSHEKGNTETLVLYFEDSNKEESTKKYMDYLFENGNYINMRLDESNKKQIAKSADNTDDLVTIETEYTDDGFLLRIIVGPGTVKLDPIE